MQPTLRHSTPTITLNTYAGEWPGTNQETSTVVRTYGLRFDVNCSILFTELPLLARPAAAKAAGFGAVEFWWPWDEMVPTDRQADAFVAALADAGVRLVSLNFHTGDMAAGERGLVSVPSAAAAANVRFSIATASCSAGSAPSCRVP